MAYLWTRPSCPVCSAILDEFGSLTSGASHPKPDDFTICLHCATPLRFTEDLELRAVSLAELDQVRAEEPETHKKMKEMIRFAYHLKRERELQRSRRPCRQPRLKM